MAMDSRREAEISGDSDQPGGAGEIPDASREGATELTPSSAPPGGAEDNRRGLGRLTKKAVFAPSVAPIP